MKQNQFTQLIGERIVLVPYEARHVPKYHNWMKSSELQELTASEPLTLEEEYKMQQSWREDENKCTFIILDKKKYLNGGQSTNNEMDSMIGDVNLFFNDVDDSQPLSAEIEIMIADPDYRGEGRGKEAILLMFKYGIQHLNIEMFTAKIGTNNQKSIRLFTKLGFVEVSRSEVFNEITFEKPVNKDFLMWINSELTVFEHIEHVPDSLPQSITSQRKQESDVAASSL